MRRAALVSLLLVLVLVAVPVIVSGPATAQQATAPAASSLGTTSFVRATLNALPPNPLSMLLARVTLNGGANVPSRTDAAPIVFAVEDGTIAVKVSGTARVGLPAPSGTPSPATPAAPGAEMTMKAGQQLVVPGKVPYALRNPTATAAHVLMARFAPAASPIPSFPSGVSVEPLARGVTSNMPAAPILVTLDRVEYAPGATIAAYAHPGPYLVYVESGTLTLPTESGALQISRATSPGLPSLSLSTPSIGTPVAVTPGTEETLTAGDSVLIESGAVTGANNSSSSPTTILVLAVRPAGGGVAGTAAAIPATAAATAAP